MYKEVGLYNKACRRSKVYIYSKGREEQPICIVRCVCVGVRGWVWREEVRGSYSVELRINNLFIIFGKTLLVAYK